MSLAVLELNDYGLSLGTADGELLRSPAFVLAEGREMLFGEEAAARSRLNPVDCNNRFWHALNMEPLHRPLGHFRHHADMAHAHLLYLAERSGLSGELVVAVPPSFDREQLRVLAALLAHSPFQPLALVDASVAQAVDRVPGGTVAMLDLQLHQMLLTVLQREDGMVLRSQRVPLPGLGWDHLSNSLMQLLTDSFVRQARFNPQHNAQWEQYLYDALPGWLQQGVDADDTLNLQIDTGSAVHRVGVTRTAIQSRLRPQYEQVLQHLEGLEDPVDTVLYTDRCAALPGFTAFLETSLPTGLPAAGPAINRDTLIQNCLRAQDFLREGAGSLQFVNAMPAARSEKQAAADDTLASYPADRPSHILQGSMAWPLAGGLLLCREAGELRLLSSSRPAAASEVLGKIVDYDGHYRMQPRDEALQLESCADSSDGAGLQVGDRIRLAGAVGEPLQLIRVHDG